jgi:DNA-binding transcriptional regulator YhcF (GntR family)
LAFEESVRLGGGTFEEAAAERGSITDFLVRALDRNLPVPVGAQLKGLIEYGIACGALRQGEKMPSIRSVALASGISPETVATAYRGLQDRGLLTSRHGSGTFIHEGGRMSSDKLNGLLETERCVDEMLRAARSAGLSFSDLLTIIRARETLPAAATAVHIVLVGIFEGASQAYAEDLATYLDPLDQVSAITVQQLASHLERDRIADIYVCLPTRSHEVSELVKHRAAVVSLSIIPADRTRSFLAGLSPDTTLGLVSRFPGFLGLMMAGAHRFAPHVQHIEPMLFDDSELEAKLTNVSVVVYATGADAVVDKISASTTAFEYRHTPDPRSIRENILPVVEEFRTRRKLANNYSKSE